MYTTNTQLLKHDVKIDSLSFNLSSVETITFRETKSILLLMMTWALASSGHEYLWYWQYSIHMHSYSIREHFITFACAVYVLRIDRKWWFAFYVFSNILGILHTCLLGQSTPVFHYSDVIKGNDGVSNYQPHDCLLNRLYRCRSKKTSKLRVTGLCEGNSPVSGEFSAQMASNAGNVSIWWRHHVHGICSSVT